MESNARKMWSILWPLVFLVAMTVLSEFGPKFSEFKIAHGPEHVATESQPAKVH